MNDLDPNTGNQPTNPIEDPIPGEPQPIDPYPVTDPVISPNDPEPFPTPPEPIPELPPDIGFKID